MNIQFKKGILELCVLVVLNKKDYYGNEIVQIISENVPISEGTIYPLLHRLRKEGLFATYLKESEEGPPRKYHAITAKGKKIMKGLEDLLAGLNESEAADILYDYKEHFRMEIGKGKT